MKALEYRYITLCLEKMRSDSTYDQLAQKYGVSRSTVVKAVKWGEKNGVFRLDLQVNVEHHILAVRQEIARLEKRLGRLLDMADEYDGIVEEEGKKVARFIPPVQYVRIFDELRQQRVLLMELEGIYRKQVNVMNVNETNNNIVVMPHIADRAEWDELVGRLGNKAPSEIRAVLEEAGGMGT
jgi:DNA-binding Lrp family transcriptional regulator